VDRYLTVTDAEPLTPLALALIVTVPDDLPVTLPFDDTVAMRESDVNHWKFLSMSLPSLSR
jgi:hypothetical protein